MPERSRSGGRSSGSKESEAQGMDLTSALERALERFGVAKATDLQSEQSEIKEVREVQQAQGEALCKQKEEWESRFANVEKQLQELRGTAEKSVAAQEAQAATWRQSCCMMLEV